MIKHIRRNKNNPASSSPRSMVHTSKPSKEQARPFTSPHIPSTPHPRSDGSRLGLFYSCLTVSQMGRITESAREAAQPYNKLFNSTFDFLLNIATARGQVPPW